MENGKVKLHVVRPDLANTPLTSFMKMEKMFHYPEVRPPLLGVGCIVSRDPVISLTILLYYHELPKKYLQLTFLWIVFSLSFVPYLDKFQNIYLCLHLGRIIFCYFCKSVWINKKKKWFFVKKKYFLGVKSFFLKPIILKKFVFQLLFIILWWKYWVLKNNYVYNLSYPFSEINIYTNWTSILWSLSRLWNLTTLHTKNIPRLYWKNSKIINCHSN